LGEITRWVRQYTNISGKTLNKDTQSCFCGFCERISVALTWLYYRKHVLQLQALGEISCLFGMQHLCQTR
jgi:hypothetical protein